MKTLLLTTLLALTVGVLHAADALNVNDNPFATPVATPAPQIVVVQPAPITPEAFTSKALAWIQAATVVGIAAIGLIGMLWTKLHDVVKRQDRQAEKTGSLQEQVTNIAAATPPPPSAPPLSKVPLIALLLAGALALPGCGSADNEFRRRVESAEVGGKAIVSPDGSTGIGGRVKIVFREPKAAIWRLR